MIMNWSDNNDDNELFDDNDGLSDESGTCDHTIRIPRTVEIDYNESDWDSDVIFSSDDDDDAEDNNNFIILNDNIRINCLSDVWELLDEIELFLNEYGDLYDTVTNAILAFLPVLNEENNI